MAKKTQSDRVILKEPTTIEELWLLAHRKGWSQQDIASKLSAAAKVEVKMRTVRSWMDGTRTPAPLMMREIEKFLRSNAR